MEEARLNDHSALGSPEQAAASSAIKRLVGPFDASRRIGDLAGYERKGVCKTKDDMLNETALIAVRKVA